MSTDPLDPEQRELCPDGRCVGVIGADGRCGTCGLARGQEPGEPVERPAAEPLDTDGGGGEPGVPDDEGPDLDSRVPCLDDTCVGILGADGSCGTCGSGTAPP